MDQFVWFVLGAIVGWLVTHAYSRSTSKEIQAVFRAFAQLAEERGLVQWTRDAKGNITTGRTITVSPKPAKIDIGASAIGTKLESE